jgi:hypothetical protein
MLAVPGRWPLCWSSMSLPPIPNTKLLEDPTGDAIWKRWLNLSFKNVNAVSSALYVSSAAFHVSTDFVASSTISTAAFRVSSFFATSSQWNTLSSAAFHVSTDFSVSSHSHSSMTSSLSANVNLSTVSQYFDGPSIAQGTSGTWFVSGTVTVRDPTSTGVEYIGKLWDTSTVVASCYLQAAPATNQWLIAALSGLISSPIDNVRISVRANSTTAQILANVSSNAHDSTITAIRIG